MLNMKALVGIRIVFMGKEFEWWVCWLFIIRKDFISVWSTCKTYSTMHKVHGVHGVHGGLRGSEFTYEDKNSEKVEKNSGNGD